MMINCLSVSLLLVIVAMHPAESKFNGYDRPDTGEPGGVIVHLMDWRYEDIAYECEKFLTTRGFTGVQVSPVTEYLMPSNEGSITRFVGNRPWYRRHQVASYIINTPSGNEMGFKTMVERCNKVGVKVYVDVVLNHMAGTYPDDKVAFAGSTVDTANYDYPAVPFTQQDFHESCIVSDYDAHALRNCEFRGLHDLNQTNPCVREKQRRFLNKLISFGVAGFRVGYAKFMWPEDLKKLFERLDYLNCDHGFACDTPPYIYQDHFDIRTRASSVSPEEYLGTGMVTEYRFAAQISNILRQYQRPTNLAEIKKAWKLIDSDKAIVFVNTYETQYESQTKLLISNWEVHDYQLAVVLMLVTPYGQPLITSNYINAKINQPPYHHDKDGRPTATNQQQSCAPNWFCEHRSPYIEKMINFRTIVKDEPVTNWWEGNESQFAFSRGRKGFVLINNGYTPIENQEFQTGLPPGTYCDIISGTNIRLAAAARVQVGCRGTQVKVGPGGKAVISLSGNYDGALVIHVGERLS